MGLILTDFDSFWAFVDEIEPEALVTPGLFLRSFHVSFVQAPVS
ncbi:hypothetical protein NHF46_07485 [Arthrobacter alpinus]|nr:hypothetical protein [Arthrobacter alpinus]